MITKIDKTVIVKVDCKDEQSISNAEKKKMQLENKGYKQENTTCVGYDKYNIIYTLKEG